MLVKTKEAYVEFPTFDDTDDELLRAYNRLNIMANMFDLGGDYKDYLKGLTKAGREEVTIVTALIKKVGLNVFKRECTPNVRD